MAGGVFALGLEGVGARLRSRVRSPAATWIDGLLGALLTACLGLGIAWVLGALALANGWERRMERALAAFDRQTTLAHPLVIEELAQRARFSVTELERFLDCSSMWFFERVIDPKEIDAVLDARIRGGIAHQTLYRFYSGRPKRVGTDSVEADRLDLLIDVLDRLERGYDAWVGAGSTLPEA